MNIYYFSGSGRFRIDTYTGAIFVPNTAFFSNYTLGTATNISLSFDLDTATYNATIGGVAVATGEPFHVGRDGFGVPHIGRIYAGFDHTTDGTGFMQIDNVTMQHTP